MANKRQCQDSPIFPPGIIEAILSKLPIESLVRFQSVSKSWEAIITSPRFNIRRSKSQPQNIYIAWRQTLGKRYYEFFSLVRLNLKSLQFNFDQSYKIKPSLPLCSCNGILLLKSEVDGQCHLSLFNPTVRSKAKILSQHKFQNFAINYGHYYDSKAEDYRVVVVSRRRFGKETYSVYSCRNRIWCDAKPFPECSAIVMELEKGMFVDGCFYWWVRGERRLVCFDVRVGTLMDLRVPDEVKKVDQKLNIDQSYYKIKVTQVAGRLCLYRKSRDWRDIRVWVMDKYGDEYDGSGLVSWKELVKMEGKRQKLGDHSCFTIQDYVVCVTDGSKSFYHSSLLVYDDREKKFAKIKGIYDDRYQNYLPFAESLFSPTKHLHPRKWSHPQPLPE